MKLYGSYPMLTFNSRLAIAIVHRQWQKILKDAVKAWVSSASRGPSNFIPVWSGMARGSIIKVGNLVGMSVPIPISPTAYPPKGPGSRTALGEAQSSARLIIVPGRYGFQWSSSVPHLEENDQNVVTHLRLKHPTPWNFKEAADKAFQEELDEGLKNFSFEAAILRSLKVTQKDIK